MAAAEAGRLEESPALSDTAAAPPPQPLSQSTPPPPAVSSWRAGPPSEGSSPDWTAAWTSGPAADGTGREAALRGRVGS